MWNAKKLHLSQGRWCSATNEPRCAYFIVSPYPLSSCYYTSFNYLGLLHAIPVYSSSERCLSLVAGLSYLWDLVCVIMASWSISKVVSHQPWDLPGQACIEVSWTSIVSTQGFLCVKGHGCKHCHLYKCTFVSEIVALKFFGGKWRQRVLHKLYVN